MPSSSGAGGTKSVRCKAAGAGAPGRANRRLRQVTTDVLALAAELRKGTIDRIMAMSDLELGLQALLGTLPPGRS